MPLCFVAKDSFCLGIIAHLCECSLNCKKEALEIRQSLHSQVLIDNQIFFLHQRYTLCLWVMAEATALEVASWVP